MRETCSDCKKPLTDPASKERGRGPKCAARHAGIKHVVRIARTRRPRHHRLPEDQALTDFPDLECATTKGTPQ